MNVDAIIMAAGLSKRMNQNKLKMKIGDKHIYEYIFEAVKNCTGCFKDVIVVAKDNDVLRKASETGFNYVKNEESFLGQSVSIRLGVQKAGLVDGFMFFVADQPYIKEKTIKKLLKAFEENPDKIIIPCCNQTNGNPVIFPYVFREQLMNLSGDAGGKSIIKKNSDGLLNVDFKSDYEFTDIDTMEDYDRAVKKKVKY
ncbi:MULTISPECIES: nucleotidyltransferase family protein [unclassified Sedimentibacter]|uniref:nucleotidyltransferase family protein n=1 Tax=unclassified Sedimentibacter TaxID=2649220 RepID=UPI0027E20588|nr:nucleotidyltransferase family protein [Sedimentibacter sp. MB35-C1]WMJ78578.1 nucleotidyltransferase family protein [Sedimentibacter sp. MB35-C1]